MSEQPALRLPSIPPGGAPGGMFGDEEDVLDASVTIAKAIVRAGSAVSGDAVMWRVFLPMYLGDVQADRIIRSVDQYLVNMTPGIIKHLVRALEALAVINRKDMLEALGGGGKK